MRYLAIGNNAKTIKSDKGGEYLTAIMYLAPADTVPGINVCPMAELAMCKTPCLFTAGRGAMRPVQDARIAKTVAFRDDREAFMLQIVADINEALRIARKLRVKLAVRLNGTSDIAWENIPVTVGGVEYANIMAVFPEVQFYDYTKLPNRKVPKNYHLTVSYSGANPAYAAKAAKTKPRPCEGHQNPCSGKPQNGKANGSRSKTRQKVADRQARQASAWNNPPPNNNNHDNGRLECR